MAAWSRLVGVVLCAGVALLGLALGAASQREVFLESDLAAAEQAAQGAASNLIPLTALLTGFGSAGAFALLSRQRPLARLGSALALAAALHVLVNLAQGAWPNYEAYLEGRTATLVNSLLAANLEAAPSVLVPVLALVAGLILTVLWSTTRLLGGPSPPAMPAQLLRRQLGALALAAPFLAVAAVGTLRLLLVLPGNERGAGPYLVVLPAFILLALAFLGTGLAKAWQLGVWLRNGRLAPAVSDSWQTLGRAEAVLATVLAALAFFASFLARLDLPELHLGRTFTVTLRGHSQFLVLVLLPLLPTLSVHREVRRRLADIVAHGGNLESGTHPLAVAAIACTSASLGLVVLTTLLEATALWVWALGALPMVALATFACSPRDVAPAGFLLAYVVWAIGNTVSATYDGNQAGVLRFDVPPGVLALLRTIAVLGAAVVAMRLLRRLGDGPDTFVVPLAAGASACAAAIALLQMPLWAWLTPRAGTDALAVGSLLASLDPAVRAAIHVVCALLSGGCALLLARLARPDWFSSRRPPLSAAVRTKAKPRTTTT